MYYKCITNVIHDCKSCLYELCYYIVKNNMEEKMIQLNFVDCLLDKTIEALDNHFSDEQKQEIFAALTDWDMIVYRSNEV